MQEIVKTMMIRPITTVGKYIMLMGRTFARPERMHMFFKQYLNEMVQLGVNSIGIVLLISFFIGAVITIQIKLNIESPWMPRFVVGYTTREIMLLEFSSSIMCLILSGKVGSNIASEIGTMRVTQQIDALEIMGVNSAGYLILPKIIALMTMIPFLVIFSISSGIIGAFCTCWFGGVMNAEDLAYGLQYSFQGVVKRHGFGGVGQATHGQHNRARKPGSIGACSYPAKVFKGMRMGGQLGGDRVTVQNLQVLKVIADHNLLLVKGSIPGCKGSIVLIEK